MNIPIELGERSYDVVIQDEARHLLSKLIARRAPLAERVVIVTSRELAALPWFDFKSDLPQIVLYVPEGERAKTLASVEVVLEELATNQISRDDVLVGVGGGAVTDLTGFVAAIYLRGVNVVQVPTSLVGQVDAALGGKTGVNIRAGKNLVGAFHQPLGVLCDESVLATLGERERRSGMGEIAKCWILEGRPLETLSTMSLAGLVEMAVRLKATLVSHDERESGRRVLLNYGHTLAHALEKLSLRRSVDELRHGEAVAIGLAFAARLARELSLAGEHEVAYHDGVLTTLGLSGRLPLHYDIEELVDAMGHDKKARHDLRFVLAGPQGYSLVTNVDPGAVRRVLELFQGEQ